MSCIVKLGILLSILTMLAGAIVPLFLKAEKKAALSQTLSHARQIGLALFDFDTDYGSYPNSSTIAKVKAANSNTWPLGDTTSNDLFKQLFVSKIITDEQIFYARQQGAREPDNIISSERETLAAGECAFAYLPGASTGNHGKRPLAVTPLIPGTLKFDPRPLEGRAVVLQVDNTVIVYEIRPDGTAVDPMGRDIFDPRQSYWEGIPPIVKWANLPLYQPPPTRLSRMLRIGSGMGLVALIGIAWFRSRARRKTRNP
jgi:type II secretory pathway pseudopilin PulG